MPFSSIIASGQTFAMLAAIGCLTSIEVQAGIENQDSGEQCWGQDCTHMNDIPVPSSDSGGSSSGYTALPNVDTYDCSADDAEKIHRSVSWLKSNIAALDAQMGRNGLMDWPGNSREKFIKKLDKELKFYCINQKDKCDDIWGIVHPVFAHKRINLCTDRIEKSAGADPQYLYTHVVAHEIGHHVRWNTHKNDQKDCDARYTEPRFAQSIGLAAEAAYLGVTYDPAERVALNCHASPPEPNPTSAWEIIDNKLQTPPLQ